MQFTIVLTIIIGAFIGQSAEHQQGTFKRSSTICVDLIWRQPFCIFNSPSGSGTGLDDQKGLETASSGDVDKHFGEDYHNDYLKVCQSPVSKVVQQDVQATLESSTSIEERLAESIDIIGTEELLQVISDSKQLLPQKIAAIEGAVISAITTFDGLDTPNDRRRCTKRILGELQLLTKMISEVQRQTTETLDDLKQNIDVNKMIKISEHFKAYMVQFDQFLRDPTQKERLQKPCSNETISSMMALIVENLQNMEAELKKKDDKTKANAVLSTTGLMSQAIAFNAVCHGVENADKPDMDQEETLKNDIDMSKKLGLQLEAAIRNILQRKSVFKRLGY